MAGFRDWLDHRTGYRKVVAALLIEHIPGGARWRYVWGSTLLFVFVLQIITGVLLMTAYSPGDSTAWGSVYYIQYEMDFGWLIRGLHHFGSGTMVVLLGLHMLQVVIAGAHLPPREINWWLGLALMGCVLAMSLTGYLLPWDQKGYEATKVATNILGTLPVAGQWLQKIIVGGPSYGHHTLTRFFALHVAILPPLIVVLIIAHMAVFRRHGVTVPLVTLPTDEQGEPIRKDQTEGWFWPDQAFRDMAVSMIIFAILLVLVIWGHGHKVDSPSADEATGVWESVAHAGREGRGANLDAPADTAVKEYPARPEWYFLFLFQLLKYFEGEHEVYGTVVVPAAAGGLLFLLPFLGHGRMRKFGHRFGVVVVSGLLLSIVVLTVLAIIEDSSEERVAMQAKADEVGNRAIQLAYQNRIPPEGGRLLLQRDPMTRGKELFKQHCGTCHSYQGEVDSGELQAGDLAGFGSEKWIRDLLRNPGDPRFFGRTKLTKMAEWAKEAREGLTPEETKAFEADLDLIAKWLSTHPRAPAPADENDKTEFAKGYRAFENRCLECHRYNGEGGSSYPGPDFTGYGSADWLRLMVMAPDQRSRYGKRNEMPAFRDLEGPTGELIQQEYAAAVGKKVEQLKFVSLGDVDRELIIRFVLGDQRPVFGGTPITTSKR